MFFNLPEYRWPWRLGAFFQDVGQKVFTFARGLVRRLAGRGPTSVVVIVAGTGGIIAVCGIALVLTLQELRQDALQRSLEESSEFAAILAGQVSRSTEALNIVLEDISARARRTVGIDLRETDLATEQTHRELRSRLASLPAVDVITITDASGQLVNSTRSWPTPLVNISDRDYFQAIRDGATGVVVSNPVANRVTAKTTVYFARRLENADGTFVGSVLIGCQPERLIDAEGRRDHVKGRTLTLIRGDGVLLSHSDAPQAVGTRFPAKALWFDAMAAGGGSYHSPGYFDGIARLIVVKPLANWPLVVNVSQREEAALSTWYQFAATAFVTWPWHW